MTQEPTSPLMVPGLVLFGAVLIVALIVLMPVALIAQKRGAW